MTAMLRRFFEPHTPEVANSDRCPCCATAALCVHSIPMVDIVHLSTMVVCLDRAGPCDVKKRR
eukprot:9074801-Karenia_brevis.AAC.1